MKIAVSAKPAPTPAGFWLRALAIAVDLPLVAAAVLSLSFLAGAILRQFPISPNRILIVGYLIGLGGFWLYWALFEASPWQATPGKRLIGLQATDGQGRRLSFARASLRNLCKVLSIVPFYLGFVLAAFTSKKQALHDLVTASLVVRVQGSKKRPSTTTLKK